MLAALSHALEARDPFSLGHAARVGRLAEAVAGWVGWTHEQLEGLRLGAALHDLGKLAVPVELLTKPGPLTPAEQAVVRGHPETGARLLRSVPGVQAAVPYALCHHERWDGRGYPAGLVGEGIPLGARLLAVADAYDAMTSERPYRRPLTHDLALAELDRYAGSQFDPQVTRAFIEVWGAAAAAV